MAKYALVGLITLIIVLLLAAILWRQPEPLFTVSGCQAQGKEEACINAAASLKAALISVFGTIIAAGLALLASFLAYQAATRETRRKEAERVLNEKKGQLAALLKARLAASATCREAKVAMKILQAEKQLIGDKEFILTSRASMYRIDQRLLLAPALDHLGGFDQKTQRRIIRLSSSMTDHLAKHERTDRAQDHSGYQPIKFFLSLIYKLCVSATVLDVHLSKKALPAMQKNVDQAQKRLEQLTS